MKDDKWWNKKLRVKGKVILWGFLALIVVVFFLALFRESRTPGPLPPTVPVSLEQRLREEIDRAIPDPVTVIVDGGVVKVLYTKKSIWDTRHLVWDLARTTCKVCKMVFEHPEVDTASIGVATDFADEHGEKKPSELAAMIVFTRETASKTDWRKLEIETVPMSAYRLVFDAADNCYLHPVVKKGLATEGR